MKLDLTSSFLIKSISDTKYSLINLFYDVEQIETLILPSHGGGCPALGKEICLVLHFYLDYHADVFHQIQTS